jgi:large exoprotein involved in heme utilization and adhesion
MALPNTNSDIVANAFEGSGGNINIEAAGVFGFDVRNENNPRQDIRNNLSASSRFGGSGRIDVPNIDPSQGSNRLPNNLVDPTNQLDRTCTISNNHSKFIHTGRGGLPPQPNDIFPISHPLVDLGPDLDFSLNQGSDRPTNPNPPIPTLTFITEAQTIQLGPNGQIHLVANPTNPTTLATTIPPCNA